MIRIATGESVTHQSAMTAERWRKIEEVFQAVIAEPPEKRDTLLDETCAGDDALRNEVQALLASDDEDEKGLEEIASGVAAEWIRESEGQNNDLIGQGFGRYRIISRLGSGGMGEVYLAQDSTLNRKVALKLLPRQFTQNADRLRRFEQEARAASALNHPNIITIYEIGEFEGSRFIATEYIAGETLREKLATGPRPLAEVLDIGMQTADALAAAHNSGIVHRDIKPANIMWRDDGYVKVLDFGLAKLTNTQPQLDVTEAGRVMGTISYMSPEQAMGQPLDHRTDIFSLGVVLYELAAGRRLFEKQSEGATYDAILHEEPPPLLEVGGTKSVEFDQVVRRALAKDPNNRYQTAADLRADLQLIGQGNAQTEAARVARATRDSRRSRHWQIAAAVAAVTILIFGGRAFLKNHSTSPAVISQKSVAVLPFSGASGDAQTASFADSVQEQILTNLAAIADLKVVSRASAAEFGANKSRNLPQIRQELGVTYVVEGTVKRAGENIEVTAQLVEADSTARIWVQTYQTDAAGVLRMQGEIAKAVAGQLRAKVSMAEEAAIEQPPTSDFAAFNLYTQAKKLMDTAASNDNAEQNVRRAIALLNEAVTRDPRFFVAHCQLAYALDMLFLSGFDNTPEGLARGQAAVDAARKLAPNSSDTHLAAAMHHYTRQEYDRTKEELDAARAISPNDPRIWELSGYLNRRQGRYAESTRDLERVIQSDPLNVNVLQELVSNHEAQRSYVAAKAIADRVLALRPDRSGILFAKANQDLLGWGNIRPWRKLVDHQLQVDPASAQTLAEYRVRLAFYERDPVGIANALAVLGSGHYGTDGARFSRAFGEGLLARMSGDANAARAAFSADRVTQELIVQSQPEYAPAISMLGLIDAGLGRKEDALREGRRAVELLPLTKDCIKGTTMFHHLAIIAAWTGENDLAIQTLRESLKTIAIPHYGLLKLDPMWDPLRKDPRFEKILASLAPK